MSDTESERIEYKRSTGEIKAIVESIAAFATAGGGTVRIGWLPDGKQAGVMLGANTIETLANDIKRNTEPPQYPSITIEGEDEAATISVRIEESPIKPVWAYGRPLKRVGRTNQRLSPEETRRLMETTTWRTWDVLTCPGASLDDMDRSAVETFLRRTDHAASGETENVTHGSAILRGENENREREVWKRCRLGVLWISSVSRVNGWTTSPC